MSSQPPHPSTPSATPHTPYVSPSPNQTTITSPPHQQPHHITEFGDVAAVHIEQHDPHHDDAIPVPPTACKSPQAFHQRFSRLNKRLFAERHLQQYWHDEVLYRTPHTRTIGPDELFLDLVIVGGIAALGHELRVTFGGWPEIEKFFLLFAAIYNSWRCTIMFWNMWGVSSDLVDKIAIYLIFTMLIFISVGAHSAFDDGVRPYVSMAAFFATAIPSVSMLALSLREPLLKNPNIRVNQLTFLATLNVLSVLPYFAAAFVPSERATRILFWVALVSGVLPVFIGGSLYRLVYRNRVGFVRLAVSIELMVEKYDVLTMIVLGESVLSILFEAGELITEDGIRLGSLFGAAAASTAMLYSLQTLYVNVDGPVAKGGKHAIRHKALNGIFWSLMHMPYHMSLILFATGLGIALRDIALPPGDTVAAEAVERLIRAEASAAAVGSERFGTPARWLFSVGWGMSIVLSGLLSLMHLAGPRAATKTWRTLIRAILALGIMVGLPFSNLSAEHYVGVHTGVLVFIALAEYLCVQMDRLGFFRSEIDFSSTKGSSTPGRGDMLDEDIDESDETPPPDDSKEDEPEGPDGDEIAQALRARMCRSHSCRLVADSKSKLKKRATARI